jgi:5-methylcytosine-specific restriction protein A
MPDQRSPEALVYRAWYKTARWRRLRAWQLRTHYLCRMCQEQDRVTQAKIVDHIRKHNGNEQLFFDPDNLQSLCKPHHDSTKQREEARGYVIGATADGRPRDPLHPWNQ